MKVLYLSKRFLCLSASSIEEFSYLCFVLQAVLYCILGLFCLDTQKVLSSSKLLISTYLMTSGIDILLLHVIPFSSKNFRISQKLHHAESHPELEPGHPGIKDTGGKPRPPKGPPSNVLKSVTKRLKKIANIVRSSHM